MNPIENQSQVPPFYKSRERREFFAHQVRTMEKEALEKTLTSLRKEEELQAILEILNDDGLIPQTKFLRFQAMHQELIHKGYSARNIQTVLKDLGLRINLENLYDSLPMDD